MLRCVLFPSGASWFGVYVHINIIATHAAPIDRGGVKCWTFITKFESPQLLKPGDTLSLRIGSSVLVESKVDRGLAEQLVTYMRITACGDVLAKGESVESVNIDGEVLPPLNCLMCMDTLGDMGLPGYDAWNGFTPNIIKVDMKV